MSIRKILSRIHEIKIGEMENESQFVKYVQPLKITPRYSIPTHNTENRDDYVLNRKSVHITNQGSNIIFAILIIHGRSVPGSRSQNSQCDYCTNRLITTRL